MTSITYTKPKRGWKKAKYQTFTATKVTPYAKIAKETKQKLEKEGYSVKTMRTSSPEVMYYLYKSVNKTH